jgi:uncharacterized protein YxjI
VRNGDGPLETLPSAEATTALGTRLESTPQLVVRQYREPWEWIAGFETRNRYLVGDARGGPLAWAAEHGSGVGAFLLRQLLGHWRKFEIRFFDEGHRPVLRAVHPFRWLFKRLEVHGSDGRRIGAIQQRFSIIKKSFDVEDARGAVVMRVRSGIFRPWRFDFERNGRAVARVQKRWTGLLTEAFTDSDSFGVSFEPSLGAAERLLVLAAAVFVDLRYFERKA